MLIATLLGCGRASNSPGGGGVGAGGGGATPTDPSATPGTCIAATAKTGDVAWPAPNSTNSQLRHPHAYDSTTPGEVLDQVTGLRWQQPAPESLYAQASAVAYCAELDGGGWRLPTRIELASLVDYTLVDPSIERVAFSSSPLLAFWTASSVSGAPGDFWYVPFFYGNTQSWSQPGEARARCVREVARPVPAAAECPAENGTVYDERTQLTWQRAVDAATFTFAEARDYCRALILGNVDNDWRAPSVMELQTIVDDAYAHPSVNPIVFPDTPSAFSWTESYSAGNPDAGWFVDFSNGNVYSDEVTLPNRVRCVHD